MLCMDDYNVVNWKKDAVIAELKSLRKSIGERAYLFLCLTGFAPEGFWPSDVPLGENFRRGKKSMSVHLKSFVHSDMWDVLREESLLNDAVEMACEFHGLAIPFIGFDYYGLYESIADTIRRSTMKKFKNPTLLHSLDKSDEINNWYAFNEYDMDEIATWKGTMRGLGVRGSKKNSNEFNAFMKEHEYDPPFEAVKEFLKDA